MYDYSTNNFAARFKRTVLHLTKENRLSIDQLCIELDMSRSQIHRKVKALTGCSTSIHIRNIKLELARDILLQSDMSIADVSSKCGIKSPQNMSKYFLQTYGLTPTQFRMQQKG